MRKRIVHTVNYIFHKVFDIHRGPPDFDGASLRKLLLNRAVANHEVCVIIQVVEVGFVIIAELLLQPFWDILAINREWEFLPFIKELACGLSQQVINLPVAKEEVVSIQ